MTVPVPLILPRSGFDAPDTYSRIRALIRHINSIREAMHPEEAIPDCAWEIYQVDLYRAQVSNGGHSQYIQNSWAPASVPHVAAGLARHAPPAYAQIFARVRALVEASVKDLASFRSGDDLGDDHSWMTALEDEDRAYYELERIDGGLVARLHTAIAGLPGLEVVDDAEYVSRMAPVLTLDGARAEALARLKAETRGAEAPQQRAVRSWVADLGLDEPAWGPAWGEEVAGEPVGIWGFVCGGEGYLARFATMHIRLVRPDGTVVDERPTAEGFAVGSWCAERGLGAPVWTGVVPPPPGVVGTAHAFTAGGGSYAAVVGATGLSVWDDAGRCLAAALAVPGGPAAEEPSPAAPEPEAPAGCRTRLWLVVVLVVIAIAVIRALT